MPLTKTEQDFLKNVQKQEVIMVKRYLQDNGNPNVRSKNHETALHFAAACNDVSMIILLRQYGADTHLKDCRNNEPSFYAVKTETKIALNKPTDELPQPELVLKVTAGCNATEALEMVAAAAGDPSIQPPSPPHRAQETMERKHRISLGYRIFYRQKSRDILAKKAIAAGDCMGRAQLGKPIIKSKSCSPEVIIDDTIQTEEDERIATKILAASSHPKVFKTIRPEHMLSTSSKPRSYSTP